MTVTELREHPPPPATFATGAFPRRRRLVLVVSALIGFALTVVWSASFVDRTIGDGIATPLLGEDPSEVAMTGAVTGILFALVTGIAGTFTACNIAVFGALAPTLGTAAGAGSRMRATLRPLGWLAVGMVAVSAAYGAVVGLVGTSMPQFSTASSEPGVISGRLLQAMIVYGIIGVVLIWMGLAALGYVRDPLAKLAGKHPNAPMVVMGALVGAFLIGRPFSLFRQLFRDAAESGNPLYGAAAFVLQSLGNVLILAVVLLAVTALFGRRLAGWLTANPGRAAAATAAGLLIAGVFLVLYWDVRLLAIRDILPWYPLAPWV